MRHYIEDRALEEDLHEEMGELMVKMMAGTMTEEEANRMIELMEQNPGPYNMMMNRMSNRQSQGDSGIGMGGFNMMSWGGTMGMSGFWFWIFSLTSIVWLVVGILAIVWLLKKTRG